MEKPNHKSPFRVPEQYFDHLEKELALKTQYPQKEEASWVTPHSYFSSFEKQLELKVARKTKGHLTPYLQFAFLSAIVGVFVFSYLSTPSNTAPNYEEMLSAYGIELIEHQLYSLYDPALTPEENLLSYEEFYSMELEAMDPDYFPELTTLLNYEDIEQ